MSEPEIGMPQEEEIEHTPESPTDIPSEIPILTLNNFVLFPFMIAPIVIADELGRKLVEEAVRGERVIGAFTRIGSTSNENGKKRNGQDTGFSQVPRIGCAAAILKLLRIPDGSIRVLVHGLCRAQIVEEISTEPHLRARVEALPEKTEMDAELEALVKSARQMLNDVVNRSQLPEDLAVAANNITEPGKIADLTASNLSLPVELQQEILETVDVRARLRKIIDILGHETQVIEIGSQIQSEVRNKMDKRQRDFVLREQLKAIKRELGEDEDLNPEIEELRERVGATKLPESVLEAAEKELTRLDMMTPAAPEYALTRNYLDWILNVPWMKSTKDKIEIDRAQKVLDEDHFGLGKIKDRILEYLAVIKLKKSLRGPILCLIGPPGVGKTSLGKSVARALGRKFIRISLGGMRDEAEIRGHRRTYIGAMPGRIISSLKNAGSNNPVMMLDEIDKLGRDFRGDPASALLEVLDPEQNSSFMDYYLDLPFDLSKVMFITTANVPDSIPGPLMDRMEMIRIAGYALHEKVEIAKRYLVPRSYENTGVTAKNVVFEDAAIQGMIEDYTREAGLRNLEREINNVCRKIARNVASGKADKVTISPAKVREYLGPPRFLLETAERMDHPGVSIGLAWTPVGGEILFVEATATEGKGSLRLTGQLGEVMRESAQAARSYLHANAKKYGIPVEKFSKQDIHIHLPAGAIPKDGPSAGLALCTAIASKLTERKVREKAAMTGEITLTGKVLPVGGVKEKVLAAHRAGIREVFLPERNEKDLDELPDEVRHAIVFHFVNEASEVLNHIFDTEDMQGDEKKSNGKKIAADKAIAASPLPKAAKARVAKAAAKPVRKPAAKKAAPTRGGGSSGKGGKKTGATTKPTAKRVAVKPANRPSRPR